MKYSLLLSILLFAKLSSAQLSLNLTSNATQKAVGAGVSLVADAPKFLWEMRATANTDGKLQGTIKAGPVLQQHGRSRLILSPVLHSDIRTNIWHVSVTPEWNWRSDRFTVSASMDIYNDRAKDPLWPSRSGELSMRPNITLQYLMYGKAYRPSPTPKKKRQKIQHGLTWWDGGALLGAVVSGVSRGTINALRKDPSSLQRYLGVGDYDWGGVQDWQRNYEGNRYINAQTGLPNPHKTEILGNFGRDAWHTADEGAKWGDRIGTACFIVGSAVQVCMVSKIEYKSNAAKKKAIRKKVLQCAIKGAALWAISSKLEQGTFDTITIAK